MADLSGVSGEEIRQVQDYIRREFSGLMRPLKQPVYLYATGTAASEVLDQGKLRAINILYLDDGRDMQHTVEYFRRAMEAREQNPAGRLSSELNDLIDQYLSRVGVTVPPDIWIVRFSADRDSAEQWRTPTEQGHAVALGFAATGLARAAEAGGVLLAPCCYSDDIKLAVMRRGLDTLERLYERRVLASRGRPDVEALVRYVTRELALFGAVMKRSDLAHEHEWRLLLCNPSQTAVGARRIMALPGHDYTGLYIDIDLADANDRLPISEVLIGPSPYQQLTARAFRTLLYKLGYDQVDVTRTQTG
jgi:hypothetical protein